MKDLTGEKYGFWRVVEEAPRDKYNKRVWICECKCGNRSEVLQGNLTTGKSTKCTSCGNKKQEGFLYEGHPLYYTWKNMKKRCFNKKDPNYHSYGGRGITVCNRWKNDFEAFVEDMGDRPEDYTLDRIDNNKGYFPDNCRWASSETQANNRRISLKLYYRGVVYTESELAKETGVSRTTIQQRRNKGWSVEEMIHGKEISQAPKEIEYKGTVYKNKKELAEHFGVQVGTLRWRLRNNWTIEESIKGK